MVEARLNVNVNTKKAQEEFKRLSVDIKEQELLVAELRTRIAEYQASLSDLSGTQRMMREGTIKELNANLKVQRASLAEMKVKAKQYNSELKSLNKSQGAGKIKAIEFNESLLKNRDITGGLSMLTGGYSLQVQKLGKLFLSASKGLKVFVAGLSTMKKVLLATGLGAVAIAIGAIVANFDKIKAFITGANRELEKLEQNTQKLIETTNSEITLLEKQKELLKLQGEDTEEINNKLIQKFELQKQSLLLLLEEYEAQQEINKENNKELTTLSGIGAILKANNASFLFGNIINSKVTKEVEKQRELDDKIRDTKKKILDLDIKTLKITTDRTKKEEEQTEELKKQEELRAKAVRDALFKEIDETVSANEKIGAIRREFFLQNLEDTEANQIAKLNLERDARIKEIEDSKASEIAKRMALAEINKFYDNEAEQIKSDNEQKRKEKVDADEKERLDKLEKFEAKKIALTNKTFDNAVKLAGEESRLGKAMLVAKTILNAKEQMLEIKKTFMQAKSTVSGAMLKGAEAQAAVAAGTAETAKIGFPQNIPMLLAYAAQAISVVSAIKSAVGKAKTVASSVGAGGGGGASIEAPKITTAAPSFNIVGSTPENQLAQTIAQQTGQPVKAYVVSGDVTTAQGLDRNIIRESALG